MSLGSVFCIIFGFLAPCVIFSSVDELVIDPKSVFVDPIMCRFCWKPLGNGQCDKGMEISPVSRNNNNSNKILLPVIRDNLYNEETCCLELKDRENRYLISLQINKLKHDPKFLHFTVVFSCLLGPKFNIIQYRTVYKGIHLELNSEFAGLNKTMNVLPECQVLLVTSVGSWKTFTIITMKSQKEKAFVSVDDNTSFSLYYTCDLPKYFKASTQVIETKGKFEVDQMTSDLRPVIQMPFRRFLKVSLRPLINSNRYDIVIYQMKASNQEECVKIFRIFLNSLSIYNDITNIHSRYICDKTISVEDLGYLNSVDNGPISFVLDMVDPLRMHRNYKLKIYWNNAFGATYNYLYFTPLPNENSGVINETFLNINWTKYHDIRNSISPIYQSVISKYDQNPFLDKKFSIPSIRNITVVSSVSRNQETIEGNNGMYNVSVLQESCQKSYCSRSFFPYFYAFWWSLWSTGHEVEIMQLPIKNDLITKVDKLEFSANDKKLCFQVSWLIPNFTYAIMPAMFVLEIVNDQDLCYSVYVLYCRTCNRKYIQYTELAAKEKLKEWKTRCKMSYRLDDQYTAIDSSISFETKSMPTLTNFSAKLYTFVNNWSDISQKTEPRLLRVDIWQTYRSIIIGVSCAGTITLIFALMCGCCCYLSRDPVKQDDLKVEYGNHYDREGTL